MCEQANKHRTNVEFAAGDLVLVKLQPYRQHSVVRMEFQKLSKRYYGPYKVLERIGSVAYRLRLPEGSKVHPVFHISLLKLWKGPRHEGNMGGELPNESVNIHPIIKPKALLACRTILLQGKPENQVLVQWSNMPTEESPWENFGSIIAMFPHLNLDNKVTFEGEGVDRTRGTSHQEWEQPIALNETVEQGGAAGISRDHQKQKTIIRRSERSHPAPGWMNAYVA